MGGMTLTSDGPTDVENWFKTWETDWLDTREEASGTLLVKITVELSTEVFPIIVLIVFQVCLGVLVFSSSWIL